MLLMSIKVAYVEGLKSQRLLQHRAPAATRPPALTPGQRPHLSKVLPVLLSSLSVNKQRVQLFLDMLQLDILRSCYFEDKGLALQHPHSLRLPPGSSRSHFSGLWHFLLPYDHGAPGSQAPVSCISFPSLYYFFASC